jgi:hypothetical protein
VGHRAVGPRVWNRSDAPRLRVDATGIRVGNGAGASRRAGRSHRRKSREVARSSPSSEAGVAYQLGRGAAGYLLG